MILFAAADNATQFAATPSGWITGVAIPFLTVLLGWEWYRARDIRQAIEKQRDTFDLAIANQNETLSKQSEALAVIVSQVAPINDRITITESNVHTLDKSLSLLQQALDLHKEWAKETADRIEGNPHHGKQNLASS